MQSKNDRRKSFFSLPRYGIASTSLWTLGIGAFLWVVSVITGFDPIFAVFSCVYLVVGFLMWQESRVGMWLGVVLFSATAVGQAARVMMDFKWRYVIYSVMFAIFAWECWQGLQRQRKEELSDAEPTEADPEDDDAAPMVSLVLLQREPKYLEAEILARYLQSAWGESFNNGNEEAVETESQNFVAGEDPIYVVKASIGLCLVHNHSQPYWEDKQSVVEKVHEMRMAKAIEGHQAWLSVDLMSQDDKQVDLSAAYLKIGQAITELADENTLAVLRPETMDINVWSPEVVERLTTPGAYLELSEFDNVPVVPIGDDDPDLIEAVETAQRRWPEFRAAFEKRSSDARFAVKAKLSVADSTEFIWIDVVGLEPNYIHGTLANDPVSLGELKLGSPVEVPLGDMQDWCFFQGDEPIGLFSIRAVQKSMRRAQSR